MLKEFLGRWVPEINRGLESFMVKKTRGAEPYGEVNRLALKFMKDMVMSPGKRIRPILLIAGYLTRKENVPRGIIDVAIALEMFHNFLLIHDDVIDRDETRRGMPTVWRRFKEEMGVNDHTAYSLAISTGDILYAYVFEAVSRAELSPEEKVKVIEHLTRTMELTGFGENLDVYLPWVSLEEVDEEEVDMVYRLKTGVYTVSSPLTLGARLAGAEEKTIESLNKYGIDVGVAFQLHDDILGVFGDPEKTGKPVGNDIREGKRTPLVLTAMSLANEDERKVLTKALGSSDEDLIKEAIEIIERTGARDVIDRRKKELVREAIDYIRDVPIREEMRVFLEELAHYLITREK